MEDLREELALLSARYRVKLAFSDHRTKLICIQCLFKQTKNKLVETLDKLLRASFYDSSLETAARLVSSIKDISLLTEKWKLSIEKEIKEMESLSSETAIMEERLHNFIQKECFNLKEKIVKRLKEMDGEIDDRILRNEISFVEDEYQSLLEEMNELDTTWRINLQKTRKECGESYALFSSRISEHSQRFKEDLELLNKQKEEEKNFHSRIKEIQSQLGAHTTVISSSFEMMDLLFDQLDSTEMSASKSLTTNSHLDLEKISENFAFQMRNQLDVERANIEATNLLISIGRKDQEASDLLDDQIATQSRFQITSSSVQKSLKFLQSKQLKELREKVFYNTGRWKEDNLDYFRFISEAITRSQSFESYCLVLEENMTKKTRNVEEIVGSFHSNSLGSDLNKLVIDDSDLEGNKENVPSLVNLIESVKNGTKKGNITKNNSENWTPLREHNGVNNRGQLSVVLIPVS
eukprot:TRINITY_DN8592_c0_g1_i1.p1 TRINITY_DN8592_c0_g1~~TRINITY_DN8592_c0_g1_i1.p1  ORF type:complete len:507 (-),score=146.59 TRINITY_DN8592_c0_g1_i1:123-1517(-)